MRLVPDRHHIFTQAHEVSMATIADDIEALNFGAFERIPSQTETGALFSLCRGPSEGSTALICTSK